MRVVVVPHDPAWSRRFESEAELVAEAFGSAAVAIHPIGSTAIPGIFAKPTIDMLVEAASLDAIDRRVAALDALAYEATGEFGIVVRRRYFRRDNAAGVREYRIHAFAVRSGEAARHLARRGLNFGRNRLLLRR